MIKQKTVVGIVSAMPIEMEQFNVHCTNVEKVSIGKIDYHFGNIAEKRIALIVSNIGQINTAAITTQVINDINPAYLIFSGIAGATNPNLKTGDIVVGETVFSAESISLRRNRKTTRKCKFGTLPPIKFRAHPFLLKKAKKIAKKILHDVIFGVVATSDYFPIPNYLPEKFEKNTVDAIDMESVAFCQICTIFEKPYIVIRGISNHVNKNHGPEIIIKTNLIEEAAIKAASFVSKLIEEI